MEATQNQQSSKQSQHATKNKLTALLLTQREDMQHSEGEYSFFIKIQTILLDVLLCCI